MRAGSLYSNFGKGHHVNVRMGRKHCKCMAFLYKHGKLQSAITWILRCESKICAIKCRVFDQFCVQNYVPNYSQFPHELFFFKKADTLSRKKLSGEPIAQVHCIVEPQCKQAPHIPLLNKFDQGRHVYVCMGRKHRKYMASLYKHGETLEGQ